MKSRVISYVKNVSTSDGNYLLALGYTAVLISSYPDHEGNKLLFLSEWRELLSVFALQGKLGNSSRLDVVEKERVPLMPPSFFLSGRAKDLSASWYRA